MDPYRLCKRGHEMTPENTNPEGRCRECRRAAQRANPRHKERMKEWRARNPEKVKEHNAKRDPSDPAYKAKRAEWVAKNPDRMRAYGKQDYERHHEKRKEYQRQRLADIRAVDPQAESRRVAQWALDNPEHARLLHLIATSRARARKTGTALIPYSVSEYQAKMAYYGNRCFYCRGPFEHTDHFKPMSKGGVDAIANLRPSCVKCNAVKGSRWPL